MKYYSHQHKERFNRNFGLKQDFLIILVIIIMLLPKFN